MITFYDCPICGQKVSKALNNCPNCGCPTIDMIKKEEPPRINPKPIKRAKSKTPIIAIVTVVVVALAVAAYFIINKLNDDKKDEKGHSDQKVEQMTQVTEEISSDSIQKYKDNYKAAFYKIFDGALKAEECGHLYLSVWYNSIYKVENEETDKYTKDDEGHFHDDFNDALGEVIEDKDYWDDLNTIKNNQNDVQTIMKALINPPEECRESYEAIKEFYDYYIVFTNLILYPSGYSYNSFMEAFNEADTNTANTIDKVKLYID